MESGNKGKQEKERLSSIRSLNSCLPVTDTFEAMSMTQCHVV